MDNLNVSQKHESKNDVAGFQLFDDLLCVMQEANNCLLLRKFEDCLYICQQNVAIARNYTENER